MSFPIYFPENVVDSPVMILGHGFARGADKMTSHAEPFASWGVEVLVPTLCHYNFLGVDHEMNGRNMVELTDIHGANFQFLLDNHRGAWLRLLLHQLTMMHWGA